MDEVFDDLVIVFVGEGENKFLIIIDSDNGVDFIWMEEMFVKVFWDGWENGEEIVKNVVVCMVFLLMKVL